MKKFLVVLGVIAVVIGALCLLVFLKMKYQTDVMDRSPVDISKVADGTYEGYSETMMVKAKVLVTVESGKITDIEILQHDCGKGHPAEAIVDDMVANNTVEVDAVSGATASSEVIKDAVRNALR